MKNLLKKTMLAFLLIGSHFSYAQWVHNDIKNGIKIAYDFDLVVNNADSSLIVSLKITDNALKKTIDYGKINLNSTNVIDSTKLSNLLKTNYAKIFSENGKKTISKHSKYLSTMTQSIKDTISQKKQRSFVYQGLFIFQSLLNGADRDTNNNGNITFSTMGSYPVALSSFVCAEEVLLNIDDFKTYLRERKEWDKTNLGIDYYLGALDKKSGTKNMVEIIDDLEVYFNSTLGWPQGGECGCCGNYSGNCYYWNSACLAHDMACQRCQYSWCFSGCVPSSCKNNTIAWYWWAL
jgi:hypothetical protein